VNDEALAKKREKAEEYAAQPDRFVIRALKIEMRSDHGTRSVIYVGGQWKCDCPIFKQWQTCSHTMAVEQLPMLQNLPLKPPRLSLNQTKPG
jgi:hypothetical protein